MPRRVCARSACTKYGAHPASHPHNVRSAKFAGNAGVARGPGSRITEDKQVQQARKRQRPQRRLEKGAILKKKELIERIAEEAKVPTTEAHKYVAAFEEVVTEALKAGEEVQITGFGKFSVRERKAREGRNPQTGEMMRIAAQKVPAFSAGNALKGAV